MNVVIVIPTYKRIEKLSRCLQSLYKQTYKDWKAMVIADNKDYETYITLLSPNQPTSILPGFTFKQSGVVKIWNDNFLVLGNFNYTNYDAVLCSVDDVEWYPDAIEEAVKTMQENFPNTDGVVGTIQECPNAPQYDGKHYGQCLIGKKFIERYKEVNYQVCCPDYIHWYQDEEMYKYANSLNKYKIAEKARLIHYHPGYIKSERDETHRIPRGEVKIKDDKTYQERQKLGLIWGKSWELVNKG